MYAADPSHICTDRVNLEYVADCIGLLQLGAYSRMDAHNVVKLPADYVEHILACARLADVCCPRLSFYVASAGVSEFDRHALIVVCLSVSLSVCLSLCGVFVCRRVSVGLLGQMNFDG
jgi:hypothetical protein